MYWLYEGSIKALIKNGNLFIYQPLQTIHTHAYVWLIHDFSFGYSVNE